MSRFTVSERYDGWGRGTEPNRQKAVMAALGDAPRGTPLLDYGCGQGAYVSAMRQAGYECVGADLFTYPDWDRRASELGAAKDDLFRQVKDCGIPFPDGHFHTAFAFEVLEHCPDAAATLREIVRVTSHGVVLSVPDCDTSHRLRQYDLAFSHWTDKTHLNFFTPGTFRDLVAKAGLEVVEVGSAYRIDLHRCFWDHVEMPALLKRIGRRLTKGRIAPYWSSILIRARKPVTSS